MLPCSLEILLHVFIGLFIIEFLELLQCFSRNSLSLFSVHLENTSCFSFWSLLFKCIVIDYVIKEFVGRFLIIFFGELSQVLDSIRSHALITSSEPGLTKFNKIWKLNIFFVTFIRAIITVGIRTIHLNKSNLFLANLFRLNGCDLFKW